MKYYFDESGRSLISDVLVNSYMDTTISTSWLQSIVFQCREVRKRKGYDCTMCLFCVCIVFDRAVGGYVAKMCWLFHLGRIFSFMSIVDHVKLETNVYTDEKRQFVNFGKIGHTSLQSKIGLSCLFF